MTNGSAVRLVRAVAAAMLCGALIALIGPIHAWASRVQPMILGLPFSILWIIFWQIMIFAALLLLYRSEG